MKCDTIPTKPWPKSTQSSYAVAVVPWSQRDWTFHGFGLLEEKGKNWEQGRVGVSPGVKCLSVAWGHFHTMTYMTAYQLLMLPRDVARQPERADLGSAPTTAATNKDLYLMSRSSGPLSALSGRL